VDGLIVSAEMPQVDVNLISLNLIKFTFYTFYNVSIIYFKTKRYTSNVNTYLNVALYPGTVYPM
jgi:hypothetical protein